MYTYGFFLQVWFNKVGIFLCTYLRVSGYDFKKYCILLSEIFLPLQTAKTMMKCIIMLHFIWVFTTCKSTSLGISWIQRFKLNDPYSLALRTELFDCHQPGVIMSYNVSFISCRYILKTSSVKRRQPSHWPACGHSPSNVTHSGRTFATGCSPFLVLYASVHSMAVNLPEPLSAMFGLQHLFSICAIWHSVTAFEEWTDNFLHAVWSQSFP